MVVLSQTALNHYSLIKTCKPTSLFTEIPVIDLKHPQAKSLIVDACHEFGFFKLVNHGVSLELMSNLETLTTNFFNLPQSEKDKAAPPNPFGYGNKRIGPNGDIGWIEYLLLNTTFHKSLPIIHPDFRCDLEEYVTEVKRMSYQVLELMADGLGIEPRNVLSKLLKDEKSDSCFRLNYYPPCPEGGRNLIGFGEHTDPQIISVLRSNNTTGLQICLRDGTWVSVPPDHSSFFINVGDALQVMTNGRFRSVKHRVLADTNKSRISMIYFGGPALNEKIEALPCLLKEGEESLYEHFTWFEYKKSAYRSRLADHRLGLFEKKTAAQLS
ncbi:gibberellin 2-beta-dioxygenase [Euphorbia lathyris]|uniref:gibberellin 2-beta-dioxygenase n=1 Tax=Euphorbia lathyris TaxID=212925 RepID=UPI003313CDEC